MTPILMIALEFAPVQTTGAFRSIDFARYLPENGIKPHVLTIEPGAGSAIFSANINQALSNAMPGAVTVDYLDPVTLAGNSKLARFLRIYGRFDDTFYGRFKASLAQQLPALANRGFKAVYVSAPPFGAPRLGEMVADALNLPLVVDLRDAWAEWGMAPYPTYLHFLARRYREARIFSKAAAVITVTERLADVFRNSHPTLPRSRFHVVPNGFVGTDFEPTEFNPPAGKETFDVAYVGSYYYSPQRPRSMLRPHTLLQYRRGHEDWSYRSPLYFLRAWREMMKCYPIQAARLRFHHIGAVPPWLEAMLIEHGFAEQTKLWGVLPKQELTGVLAGMDAQLATSMKRPQGGDYCLASKTFDYLSARKPIVAFVTDGSQRDFLVNSGAAIICDPDLPEQGMEQLRSMVDNDVKLRLNADFVNRFHRRQQAKQLGAILHNVCAGSTAGCIDSHRPEESPA